MINWITNEVTKSISAKQEQEQDTLQACLNPLMPGDANSRPHILRSE